MILSKTDYPDSGKVFVHLDSTNITGILAVAQRGGLHNFCLNPAFGWAEGSDLDFLKDHLWIKGIALVCKKCDLTPINYLHNLEYFSGPETTYKGKIDFSNFSKLAYLVFNWDDKKFSGFETLTKLKDLSIWRSPFEDLSFLQSLKGLKRLELNYSNKLRTFQGVENLRSLLGLNIYSAPNLEDISTLAAVAGKLRNLNFELCPKIESFSVMSQLLHLETFVVQKSAPLQSVQFIKHLANLRYAFIGSEILDGDVEILKEKKIGYRKLKKYDQ